MKFILAKGFLLTIIWQCCVAAPYPKVQHSLEEILTSIDYKRYLQEVTSVLEKDREFKKRIENANEADVKTGKIASELEFVSHSIRTQLDELKRQELIRLRSLNEQKNKLNGENTAADSINGHIDDTNPHTFEINDLQKLIVKNWEILNEYDEKRRENFKNYELTKEYEKQLKLNSTTGEERLKLEKEYKEIEEKHKQHEPLHEPGHKAQIEEVWKEQDKMTEEFNPKVFFMMHDLDSNGLWDQDEVKVLFIKELNKVYGNHAVNDDLMERIEEMERMREAVFKQIDVNRDGVIDYKEFLSQTQSQEYQQDHGWKGVEEVKPYTDEELENFIKELQKSYGSLNNPMPPQPGTYNTDVPPPNAHNPNVPP